MLQRYPNLLPNPRRALWSLRAALGVVLTVSSYGLASAQTFFSDASDAGYYDTGLAFATAPSVLAQAGPSGDKIPVSTEALFDRDALRVSWTSKAGGDWSALIITPGFGFQDLSTSDTLSFWVYSPEVLAKADLPNVFLEGATGASKSARYPLSNFLKGGEVVGGRWQAVNIPLARLRADAVNAGFDFSRTKAVILGQAAADGEPHTLYVDQVQAFNVRTQAFGSAPAAFTVRNYPRHREIRFARGSGSGLYRALIADGVPVKVVTASAGDSLFLAWANGAATGAADYRLTTYTPGFGFGTDGATVAVATLTAGTDEEYYDMTQRYTLRYFWDFAHPVSGLARERNTSGNTVTIGGSGFGLMDWLVGVERGWLTRDEVAARMASTLTFLEQADRFHGVWPHWMDGRTGRVIPFSPRDNGGDLVETAFMAQALLTVREYFDGEVAVEDSIRQRCTRLWEDIEWDWYQRPGEDLITWHWSPDQAWAINLKIRGFNEAQIVYLLAIASPTHPVPATAYTKGWITPDYRSFQGRYGIFIPAGPRSGGPMFFAHYSYMGFDPRYWRDEVTNYFLRNQLHVDYQVAYAKDNPEGHVGYSAVSWGQTASDDPLVGYAAHEANEPQDNGTITPTAALASMPYRPGDATNALKHFYTTYGARVFGEMGFYDAFNPGLNWYTTSTIAIDQGPIVGMIENHRSGLLWRNFMKNPEIAPALRAAGFTRDSTTVGLRSLVLAKAELKVSPNPAAGFTQLQWPADLPTSATVVVYDALGRVAFRQNLSGVPGEQVRLNLDGLSAGVYHVHLTATNSGADALAGAAYRTSLTIIQTP